MEKRTDLAVEAQEIWKESAGEMTQLRGVEAFDENIDGFPVTTVKILDREGEQALCKPVGDYITITLDKLLHREEDAFSKASFLLAGRLRDILKMMPGDSVLVAGLGNSAITPDAIGPEAVDCVMVTKHLKEHMPGDFAAFREVAAIRSGVLGTTGIESAAMVSAIAEKLRPDKIIAVDALASRNAERLCRTVQLSDTGIVPGSGVGNSREALNRETLGVPVIAIGVPTVVDAATLVLEMAEHAGVQMDEQRLSENAGMIVTPRDIDKNVKDISKLVGYSINLALHDGLTLEDVDMFLS